MAGYLSGVGTASYNGVTFPNQMTMTGNSRSIYDVSGRMVKYVEHTFTIEFILHDGLYTTPQGPPVLQAPPGSAGDSVDSYFLAIRERLEQSSGQLIIENKGFGSNFAINTKQSEVAWGPKPEILVWESIGSSSVIRVVWTVTVRIFDRTTGALQTRGAVCDLSYSILWNIVEKGLTTRTISGTVEIAARRNTPLEVAVSQVTADFKREAVNIEIPLGFSRTTQSYPLSPDKSHLSFTIVDEELPSDDPYFPGTIKPQITYSVNNTNVGLEQWDVSLSGSIEVAAGVPRWFAWAAFVLIVKNRQSASKRGRVTVKDSQDNVCSKPSSIVIVNNISISEQVYDRGMSFSMGWLLSTSLDSLFRATGMWAPLTGLTWQGYRTSMTTLGRTWTRRGHAQMSHTNESALVNLEPGFAQTINILSPVRRGGGGSVSTLFGTIECPPAQTSWLVFQNAYEYKKTTNTVTHKPLTEPVNLEQLPKFSPGNIDGALNKGTQSTPPILQQRGEANHMMTMRGWAMRVCYPIPPPKVRFKYAGAEATIVGDDNFKHKLVGVFGKIKLYAARWETTYSLDRPPTGNPTQTEINEECQQ